MAMNFSEAEREEHAALMKAGKDVEARRLLDRVAARERAARERPGILQGQAERCAGRNADLEKLWPSRLDAVIGMLEEQESLAAEADRLRNDGAVATEHPSPASRPERLALIADLRAAVAKVTRPRSKSTRR